MRILLVGTGRVAYNLGDAMDRAGLEIVGVAGRDPHRTRALADHLGTIAADIEGPLPEADLILIAVSDDAIPSVAAKIPPTDAVVVHTSGASSLEILSPHAHTGVLWPVQTFIGDGEVDLSHIPLIVEGNDPEVTGKIRRLAEALSDQVIELGHEKRQRLHLAAVLTCNLPVILVSEAQRLLHAEGLPKDLLDPLWLTTAANVAAIGPDKALTGPARRGDKRTIQRHLELLNGDPDLRQVYSMISNMLLKHSRTT